MFYFITTEKSFFYKIAARYVKLAFEPSRHFLFIGGSLPALSTTSNKFSEHNNTDKVERTNFKNIYSEFIQSVIADGTAFLETNSGQHLNT